MRLSDSGWRAGGGNAYGSTSRVKHSREGSSSGSVSSQKVSGDAFEFSFGNRATYHYYCEPHAGFMAGTITVE